jgi:hypothetical protein
MQLIILRKQHTYLIPFRKYVIVFLRSFRSFEQHTPNTLDLDQQDSCETYESRCKRLFYIITTPGFEVNLLDRPAWKRR